MIEGASPLFVNDPAAIRGKRVLVIEDGPTLTHGEMAYGAGWVAARRFGAAEIVDPRPYAVGSIADTYRKYPKTGAILPAMGYGDDMVHDLEATINRSEVDMVISATPIDLTRIIRGEQTHAACALRAAGDWSTHPGRNSQRKVRQSNPFRSFPHTSYP